MKNQDSEIWNAFIGGDKTAFKEIYERFSDHLFHYGYKFTEDAQLLEDVLHQLFLKMWESRKNLNEPSSLRNYLFKAFRNTLFNQLAAQQRRATVPLLGEDYAFDLEPGAEDNIILSEEEEAQRMALSAGLRQLTGRQREAVYLRFYLELSYEDLASVLGIDRGGAYKLVHRAISRLRDRS